jgi:hypothetical protein
VQARDPLIGLLQLLQKSLSAGQRYPFFFCA